MSIGSAIRKQRKSLHITLAELATSIDSDAGNISRIERGEQGAPEAMLCRRAPSPASGTGAQS